MYDFNSNAQAAKIQGLSVQAGELFADLYRDRSVSSETVDNALEAYKSLRRHAALGRFGPRLAPHRRYRCSRSDSGCDLIPDRRLITTGRVLPHAGRAR